jgi:hypothetical protein
MSAFRPTWALHAPEGRASVQSAARVLHWSAAGREVPKTGSHGEAGRLP